MRLSKPVAAFALMMISACGGNSPTEPSQRTCTPVTTSALLRLQTGESFRVRFSVPTGLTPDIVVMTYLGLPNSGFASSGIVHRLYDGTTLLGTYESAEPDTIAFWKSPESSFGLPTDTTYGLIAPAVTVNFDSILRGTIDGRVELAVTRGTVTILSAREAEVVLIGPARGSFPDTRAAITAREWCR